MPLKRGSRLGAYEIVTPLGAGGMGEVDRARDSKLGRDVALKILLDSVAQDSDRVARFKREAQVLAALNHPHIAAIYGFDEAGATRFLVLELVEGETLADRLKRGPIPVDETIVIARQIAEALAEAHEKGIIHRDLKPANIAMSGHDQVKVLDFGLAKLSAPPGSAGVAQGFSPASVSMSPTLTTPAMVTGVGMILGTAAYMAPEQAKGREADKRCDLWAFGCVVYEMLTAKRAFEGEDITDTIAAVMRGEPNWSALPPDTPANVRLLLESCLTKDRRRRAADIAVVQFLLGDRATVASAVPVPALTTRHPVWRRALPWGVAGVFAVALVTALQAWSPWRAAATPRVTRLTITTSGPAALTMNGLDRDLAVSPDGLHVVYLGNNRTQLFVRALDSFEPIAIATNTGTSGNLRSPFISPDGQWVGFVSGNTTIRKVAITGGPPVTVATLDGVPRGASWAPDGTIVFATVNLATGLQRVSAAGGTPEVLTRPDHAHGEADHVWPELLPGGRAVLFTITMQTGGLDAAQVVVRDLATGTQKVLVRGGTHAHYTASGHLVYVAAGTLRAIAFDSARLETHGTAVPVLPRLATTDTGTGDFALSSDGTLIYVDVPGSILLSARTLVWVNRTGKEEAIAAPPRAYQHPRLSPDGTRVAVFSNDQENDIWIWSLQHATLTRLTLESSRDEVPIWTPDGRRIVFSSNRESGGSTNLWWQAADGTGVAERLTTSSQAQFATGTTPDGTAVLFMEQTPTMGGDLLQVALDGTRRVTPLLHTKVDERNGIVSPSGRWLAYDSNSSGTAEIYVRPFPNVGGGQWQVSTAGGRQPLWARNGKELFYLDDAGGLSRVLVETSGTTWNAGTPMKLFEGRYYDATTGSAGRSYDVSPDGERFLMIKRPGSDAGATSAILVVQHWNEELKRLVPTK